MGLGVVFKGDSTPAPLNTTRSWTKGWWNRSSSPPRSWESPALARFYFTLGTYWNGYPLPSPLFRYEEERTHKKYWKPGPEAAPDTRNVATRPRPSFACIYRF